MRIPRESVERLLDDQLPRWSLEARIRHGRYGDVWCVTDGARRASLKIFEMPEGRPTADWRLLAKDHRRLRCRALVGFQDFFRADVMTEAGTPRPCGVVLMDYFPRNLHRFVLDGFPPSAATVARLFRAVTALMADLRRDTGLFYGDLKPKNVLADRHAARLVLADYGGLYEQYEGVVRGQYTAKFAAPERLAGRESRGEATLVYPLGLVGFWLASGRVPHESAPVEDRFDLIARDGLDLDAAEAARLGALRPVVETCLAQDPAGRYARFDELLAAIDAAA